MVVMHKINYSIEKQNPQSILLIRERISYIFRSSLEGMTQPSRLWSQVCVMCKTNKHGIIKNVDKIFLYTIV